MSKSKEALLDPLFTNNPIALQVLGICSALAVTKLLQARLGKFGTSIERRAHGSAGL